MPSKPKSRKKATSPRKGSGRIGKPGSSYLAYLESLGPENPNLHGAPTLGEAAIAMMLGKPYVAGDRKADDPRFNVTLPFGLGTGLAIAPRRGNAK